MAETASCGCPALARAISDNYDAVVVVPGQPVTHLCELLAAEPRDVEWSLNEKHAMEEAVGLSVSGVPTALVMKHNGLSICLDPLANASRHGIGAPVLLVVGDDHSAASSTTLQDSRALATTAGVPVLDPAGAWSFRRAVAAAWTASAEARIPVVLRVSAALHAPLAAPAGGADPATGVARRTNDFDRAVAHDITKFGRYTYHRTTTWPRVAAVLEPLAASRCAGACGTGVVAVGTAAAYVPDGTCVCRVEASWPLPPAVAEFAAAHASTLVVEEPGPFVEDLLATVPGVVGRRTGHLRPEGPLDAAAVARAAAGERVADPAWDAVDARPASAPKSTEFAHVFEALARVPRDDLFVAADVGSSVQLCYPPYARADVALCLGSAASVAAGAARAGRAAVAVLGDHGLLHSGLQGVYDAARRCLPVVLLVLANGTCAQTGGQPVAASPEHAGTLTPDEVVALLRGLGVEDARVLPATEDAFHALTLAAKSVAAGTGPVALVAVPAGDGA